MHAEMAKYVIAGRSDCPYYARAELMADELALKLPSFQVHKIVIEPDAWQTWVVGTCTTNGWTYSGESPIVWRELINRGGKGTLLGGCNDFLEMAKCYYGITCEKITQELRLISAENVETKVVADALQAERINASHPFHITVTAVHSSPLAYHILPQILNDKHFLSVINEQVLLTLFEHESCEEASTAIDGLCMEVEDCACASLKEVRHATDTTQAFQQADLIIILDDAISEKSESNEPSITEENQRKHLQKLKQYGESIDELANKHVKIIVAGSDAIVDCYVLSQFAKQVDRKNFFALTRDFENKVKAKLAKHLNIKTVGIQNLILFGEPKEEFVADCSSTVASGYDGAIWGPHIDRFSHQVNEVLFDKSWMSEAIASADRMEEKPKKSMKDDVVATESAPVFDMVVNSDSSLEESVVPPHDPTTTTVDPPSSAAQTKLPESYALSKAAALMTQFSDLFCGEKRVGSDQMFSLGLISEGWFGVEDGLVFSVPVSYEPSSSEDFTATADATTATTAPGLKVRSDMTLSVEVQDRIRQLASNVREKCQRSMKLIG